VSERPTKDELVVLINTMSMLAIGRKFGVSDNAVRKWCKYYEISKSS
jgi:transposase-like protein